MTFDYQELKNNQQKGFDFIEIILDNDNKYRGYASYDNKLKQITIETFWFKENTIFNLTKIQKLWQKKSI